MSHESPVSGQSGDDLGEWPSQPTNITSYTLPERLLSLRRHVRECVRSGWIADYSYLMTAMSVRQGKI